MPELPEVETVMRALAARVGGLCIESAHARRRDLRWPLPEDLEDRLRGRRILGFARRGKYILARLSGGETLLLHLGMTGRILFRARGAAALRHEHFTLTMEGGTELRFVDPRRFGSIDLVPTQAEERHPRLALLGPDPLSEHFTEALFAAALAGRRTAIKTALLDQHTLAGLGNIYACEALFRARISPRRRAANLGRQRIHRLFLAIRATLGEAIAAGGSSFSDYVQPSGALGSFQRAWRVYGRTRCACCPGPPRCVHGVARIVQAGRSSFYCPIRQR